MFVVLLYSTKETVMKKLSAFALLAVVSAAASAQSSLTLFGIVDVGVRRVENDTSKRTSLSTSAANSSRLGFRGVEDLGGGLSAGFWLEAGLAADTGAVGTAAVTATSTVAAAPARFFDRRSTLSLMGGFGELRLGRDLVPSYTGAFEFDVFPPAGIGSADKFYGTSSLVLSAAATAKRDDNMVSYFLPKSLGGLYGQLSAAPSEGTIGYKYEGGRLGYAAGPVNVSVSYGQTDVTPNASGEDKYKVSNIGASYDFGIFKLSGYYNELKLDPKKLDIFNLGVAVPVGSGSVRASYTQAKFKGGLATGATGAGVKADAIALGYLHDLSRRTALYATLAQVTNKGGLDTGTYGVDSLAVPAGKNSKGFEVGIRHSF
jgi:predicted porin